MKVTDTERLTIRHFEGEDADFIVRLLNDPSFIRHIADKQVRTREDAVSYLENGPMASYRTHGYGLNLVQLKGEGTPIGMCGLVKRHELEGPDLGYAFLPEFCGQGYAFEAAEAVLEQGMAEHALDSVLAVTLPDNTRSNRLLNTLGFSAKWSVNLYGAWNNLYEYRRSNDIP
ncbi:GNAT family N-acetyltransferase [Halomonas saccharevitans]|uniref:GNAT family N-acetyltransferase n=1 Tax=Halomonas saccharevitans TaxID=416872 RepID=A0ABU3NHA9_9GAMM|nr:GNAT family N-acetyltransferase [Halomonas saccharevitans]MDT8880561.1 GNAT family N-acetyltransferase [Halomonas saccharevitans]